jgi:hypothetical protein
MPEFNGLNSKVRNMDVQNPLNLFSSLNNATRSLGSAAGRNWSDVLELAPANPADVAQTPTQSARPNKAFANLLNEAIEARPTPERSAESIAQERALREKFQIIVNKFFLGSMMKQMRNSPFKNEMFNGGKGGEAFQGLMDQHLTEHAGGKVAKSLVDAMVKRAMGPEGNAAQLYLDPQQQKQLDAYRTNERKRVKHDAAASFTA